MLEPGDIVISKMTAEQFKFDSFNSDKSKMRVLDANNIERWFLTSLMHVPKQKPKIGLKLVVNNEERPEE